MRTNVLIRSTDLIDNPTARVPICLCLDVSGSMYGDPIRELNEGVQLFYQALAEDEIAAYSAEVCIVTFGMDGARLIADFSSIAYAARPPVLEAYGQTQMGEAVSLAMDKLMERKQQYKDNGVEYYQPWLVLMTDGAPNGNPEILQEAIRRVRHEVENRKLSVFPIGVGSEADMRVLAQFSPKRDPLMLWGLAFREFFQWLSSSVSAVSQSRPGERVKIDVEAIKGWGEL